MQDRNDPATLSGTVYLQRERESSLESLSSINSRFSADGSNPSNDPHVSENRSTSDAEDCCIYDSDYQSPDIDIDGEYYLNDEHVNEDSSVSYMADQDDYVKG